MALAVLEQGGGVQRHGEPIEAWLDSISERKRAAVLAYTAAERSPVLSYLYASMLGLEVGIDDFEAWIFRRWDRLDTRSLLQAEVVNLQRDIAEVREAISEGRIRRGDGPTKISYLSRELRGHIETLSKEQTLHDRRSLILAGVEVAASKLRKVFGRDGSTWPAIEAVLEAAYADVEERHKAK